MSGIRNPTSFVIEPKKIVHLLQREDNMEPQKTKERITQGGIQL